MGDREKVTNTVKGVEPEAWEKAAASAKRHGETTGAWFSRLCHQIAAQEEGDTPPSAKGKGPALRPADERPDRMEGQVNSVERQQARMAADLADLRMEVLELRRRIERVERG